MPPLPLVGLVVPAFAFACALRLGGYVCVRFPGVVPRCPAWSVSCWRGSLARGHHETSCGDAVGTRGRVTMSLSERGWLFEARKRKKRGMRAERHRAPRPTRQFASSK